MMDTNQIQKLKRFYTKGTHVELVSMDDVQAPPKGTHGVVLFVDDIGSIHVLWDNGATLALLPEVDSFKIIL